MTSTKRSLLALLCVAGAALTAQATKITGWTSESVTGMNPDYVDTTKGWTIPTYDNQIVLVSSTNAGILHLTGTQVWSNNHTYVLVGAVLVGNETNPAITGSLYIQPGTVIRGMPWRTGVADSTPGGLYICAGSKIFARGNPTNPIIFTDMWDNNVPGMTPGTVTAVANQGSGYTNPASAGWPHGYLPAGSQRDGYRSFTRDYSIWQPTFGYWGGVILNGRTAIAAHKEATGDPSLNWIGPVTNTTANADYVVDEGLTFKIRYGGVDGIIDEDDSSGAFTYCQIRYNGYPLQTGGSEINGLSLYGVGRGTELHHIEIMNSGDDSVEWFGGTVNMKYAVTWAYGDDGWDTDQGFRGKNQFLFAMQGTLQDVINQPSSGTYGPVLGSAHSDKGMEMDSGDNDGTKRGLPLALSAWWNGTWVGQGPTNDVIDGQIDWASEATGAHGWDSYKASLQPTANSCLMLRDGACPQIYNGIFTEFRGAGIVMEYTAINNTSKTRMDGNGFYYDTCVHAGRAWNSYPAVNGPAPYTDNAYVYQDHTEGYMMDLSDCVFYKLGFGAIVPTSGVDMENASGRETAGSKNNRHLSLRWNIGSTAYTCVAGGESGLTSANFTDFPGLLSGTLSPNVSTAVSRIISNNELAASNPIGTITRAAVSDYRYAKGVRNVLSIDPYPVTGNVLGSRRTPPDDGFYTPVNFKGAFDPTKVNWMHGWTLSEKLGLVEMHTNLASDATAPTTDASGAVVPVSVTATIGTYPAVRAASPVAGGRYQIEAASSLSGPWSVVGYIDEDGSDKWYTDASGAGNAFFRTKRIK